MTMATTTRIGIVKKTPYCMNGQITTQNTSGHELIASNTARSPAASPSRASDPDAAISSNAVHATTKSTARIRLLCSSGTILGAPVGAGWVHRHGTPQSDGSGGVAGDSRVTT